MAASLPKAIAFRAEPTGHAASDRAQRMAQDVGRAHEQTKVVVSAVDARTKRGVLRLVLSGAGDVTLSDVQNAYPVIDLTGTLSAGINLNLGVCTDETARVVFVNNATSGGFAVSLLSGGTGAGLAAGSRKAFLVSAAGVTALT
jgi:hypothetical protein